MGLKMDLKTIDADNGVNKGIVSLLVQVGNRTKKVGKREPTFRLYTEDMRALNARPHAIAVHGLETSDCARLRAFCRKVYLQRGGYFVQVEDILTCEEVESSFFEAACMAAQAAVEAQPADEAAQPADEAEPSVD